MTSKPDLYTPDGQRKYLTPEERSAFISAASKHPDHEARTFCLMIAHTGCRISEGLELTLRRVDFEDGRIVIRSKKKRGTRHHRAVPVPPAFLDTLDLVHGLRRRQAHKSELDMLLWSFGRTHGWKLVKDAMAKAGIEGPHANPKALRHGFAVSALEKGVPLTLIRTWLGHADLNTTSIYLSVGGQEETGFAQRLWS